MYGLCNYFYNNKIMYPCFSYLFAYVINISGLIYRRSGKYFPFQPAPNPKFLSFPGFSISANTILVY